MKSLLEKFLKTWFIESNFYLVIVALILIVLGYFIVIFIRFKLTTLKSRNLQWEINRLKDQVKKIPFEDLVKSIDTTSIQTINLYRSNHIHTELYKAMLVILRSRLMRELHFDSGDSFEEFAKLRLFSPVLVICPALKKFYYHFDEEEDRVNTLAFEVQNNDSNQLFDEVKNYITLLGGTYA